MRLLKLTLRDLFWLVVVVATLVAWGLEHQRLARQLDEAKHSFFFGPRGPREPSEEEISRLEAHTEFAKLSNDELNEKLARMVTDKRGDYFEVCLAEMARRRMHKELRKQYDELMVVKGEDHWHFDDLELLTALRRAEGKHDPLRITVSKYEGDRYVSDPNVPILSTTVENVDEEGKAFYFVNGGDDRGGRRERWHLVLTDQDGRRVAQSNFQPHMGGGLAGIGWLKFGERGRGAVLDMRRYVAPPRSGTYRLQVFYHNDRGIANEPDLRGLIVSKSEPITVEVRNPAERLTKESIARLIPLGIAIVTVAAFVATLLRRRPADFAWRDLVWCVLLVGCCTLWWFDADSLKHTLARSTPDAEASWTIVLPDEKP